MSAADPGGGPTAGSAAPSGSFAKRYQRFLLEERNAAIEARMELFVAGVAGTMACAETVPLSGEFKFTDVITHSDGEVLARQPTERWHTVMGYNPRAGGLPRVTFRTYTGAGGRFMASLTVRPPEPTATPRTTTDDWGK